jgi:hypothetical protein
MCTWSISLKHADSLDACWLVSSLCWCQWICRIYVRIPNILYTSLSIALLVPFIVETLLLHPILQFISRSSNRTGWPIRQTSSLDPSFKRGNGIPGVPRYANGSDQFRTRTRCQRDKWYHGGDDSRARMYGMGAWLEGFGRECISLVAASSPADCDLHACGEDCGW